MVLIFNNVVPLRIYKGHHKYKKHREVVFLFMIFAGGEPRVRTEGFGICVANDNLPQKNHLTASNYTRKIHPSKIVNY